MHQKLSLLYTLLFFINGFYSYAPKGHPKVFKTKSVEKELIRMLIARYQHFGVIGRPVNDSSMVMEVQYGLQLIQILDLDENKQILRTNCWSVYRWNDSLLQWDARDHGNISEIRLFPSLVWTPDIQLYNFADERVLEHRIARVVVHNDGSILWVPQALFKSACQVGITFFPFDTQICTLEFGSWTYDKTQIDILWWVPPDSPEPMPYLDFSDYVPSNEWRTDGEMEMNMVHTNRTKQIKSLKKYRERNQTSGNKVTLKQYPVLCYRIRLHRNPSFYVFILVIPCILLSSLTVVVFWLPPESPAKMMLGMNIFVAFFLLLLLLADLTPNAVKEFPLIGAYFCLNMIMITLSTFLATLVIHLYYRGDRNGPLPAILHRIIVEGMGRLMLVRQHIPLPETKTLSHVVTRSSNCRGRRRIRVPELPSGKFTGDDDYEESLRRTGSTNQQVGCRHNQMDGMGVCMNNIRETSGCGAVNYMRPAYNLTHCTYTCPCHGRPSDAFATGSCGDLPMDPPSICSAGCRAQGPLCCHETGARHATPPPNDDNKNGYGDSEDSPIMLSTSTSLERDVRELKRYVRLFVNRQKESTRKNAIAMEWRTMALVLDRLFFFMYIATIGITVVTSLPGNTDPLVTD